MCKPLFYTCLVVNAVWLTGCSTHDPKEEQEASKSITKTDKVRKTKEGLEPANPKNDSPPQLAARAVPATNQIKPYWSDEEFRTITVSPDGLTLVTAGKNQLGKESVRFWDSRVGEIVQEIHFGAWSLSYCSDGRLLLIGGFEKVAIWDVAAKKIVWETRVANSLIKSSTFSGDGNRFAVCLNASPNSSEGTFRVWETASKKQVNNIASHNYLRVAQSVGLSPNGRFLAGQMGPGLRLWEVGTGTFLGFLGPKIAELDGFGGWRAGAPVLFSPDEKYLASARAEGKQQLNCLWEWPSLKIVWEIPTTAHLIGFTADSNHVIYGGRSEFIGPGLPDDLPYDEKRKRSSSLQFRRVTTGELVPLFLGYNRPFSLAAISRDGKKIAVSRTNTNSSWEVLEVDKQQEAWKRPKADDISSVP